MVKDIIMAYFETDGEFHSLAKYVSEDTLVSWFVDNGYLESIWLYKKDRKKIQEHYDKHCRK